ncbi:MAG: hypothetical protein ACFFB0_14320 [Promethearchaeota archaeon]
MNLQFFETLDDKSKKYVSYLVDQILPQFTYNELNKFLDEIKTKPVKNSKSTTNDKFLEIGKDKGKLADISKLNEIDLKTLFQIFISREINHRLAVKWRFYQYIKYYLGITIKSMKVNQNNNSAKFFDFILETEENETIFISCHDTLELDNFNQSLKDMAEFAKKQNTIPHRIIIAANKSFRNIPLDESYKIINTEITPELWIEWIEENRVFNKEDLIIVDNSELKLAGFNYTSMDDLLNYVYKYSNGGQILIFKQSDFFIGATEDETDVELIWKGIMIK